MDIIPHGPISLPTDATFVSDADEEIFLLYTRLAALKPPDSSDTGHFHGLGTENPKDDALLVRIELKPPPVTAYDPAPKSEKLNRNIGRRNRRKKREGSGIRFDHGKELEPVVLEYRLFQDITALRSRSGDTGSVLWKTSIEFLSLILRQLHFPEPTRPGLFDHAKLRQTHVLELGAGTGLLALALSPLVRSYTATDIPALLPLLRKNVLSAPPTTTSTAVTVAALDWTLPTLRQIDVSADPPDVLLVVDCIYHPTLVRPLLTTMTALAAPRHTVALVVAELRAEDVLRDFLEGWIELGWRVWSIAEGLLGPRWGMWIAWRES
ncbi:putative methyltransferase-domain-containing protein [Russula vinacea]|nr:putative methyltransferase-domain-containing protein [Russula vinacea]